MNDFFQLQESPKPDIAIELALQLVEREQRLAFMEAASRVLSEGGRVADMRRKLAAISGGVL